MDHVQGQYVVDQQIRRFGGSAVLSRGGVQRNCIAGIQNFSTADRQGSLIQWNDVRVLVSGLSLAGLSVPDNELDILIFKGVTYRIVAPPARLCPDGEHVFYWDLICRSNG